MRVGAGEVIVARGAVVQVDGLLRCAALRGWRQANLTHELVAVGGGVGSLRRSKRQPVVAEFCVPVEVQRLAVRGGRRGATCLKGVNGPRPGDLLVAFNVLIAQRLAAVNRALVDLRSGGVVVARPTGDGLDDLVCQRAFEQPAVQSVLTPRRQSVLRQRTGDELTARGVHLVAVPRVDLHREHVDGRRGVDDVRHRRRKAVVAFAVLAAVSCREVRVRRDAERAGRVLDGHRDEVRVGSQHRGDRGVRRVVRNFLHPGAAAQHGGVVVVVVGHVDRHGHVLLQGRAVEVLVALLAHLIHLVAHDRHPLPLETLHQLRRDRRLGQIGPEDLRVAVRDRAHVDVERLDAVRVVLPLRVVLPGGAGRGRDDVPAQKSQQARGG